jgi:hypothetical protein
LDSANTDYNWNSGTSLPINFDGVTGPGGISAGQTTPNYTSEWDMSTLAFGTSQFLPVLGIPLVASASNSYDALTIGTGSAQFNPSKFHKNFIRIKTDVGNASRAANGGGCWSDSNNIGGRFTLDLRLSTAQTPVQIGFRCRINAE